MGLRFIFMLTRNDRTVADAAQHLDIALDQGVRHIGFKDIGLPIGQLKTLNDAIKASGATSYLEVVSLDRASEIASARAAVEIGVDILLGGTRADDVLPIIGPTRIRYFPFPGQIVGHPSILEGGIEDIVASAKAMAARDGVGGLDLLAYRSKVDVPALVRTVCAAVNKPVIVAGSIDTPEQIACLKEAGAAGFTIGTAALDGRYPAKSTDVGGQLAAVIRDVAVLNGHISEVRKTSLSDLFGRVRENRAPWISACAKGLHIKLSSFEGESPWHFPKSEDELVFVHKGRLLMKFRDRDEVVHEGEFIVVRRGVEYRKVAMGDACELVLLEANAQPHFDSSKERNTIRVTAR